MISEPVWIVKARLAKTQLDKRGLLRQHGKSTATIWSAYGN